MSEHDIVNNLTRLGWACRRGMLELDVLLGNFLKEAYPGLALSDKHTFIRLLDCADPELFNWLLGHETPEDAELANITSSIRQHARARFST